MGAPGRGLIVAAEERTEFAVVVFLVFDDVVENGDGAFVAEFFQLFAVVGDVTALFDFKATQGHADSAGAVGKGVGFATGISGIDRLGTAKFDDAAVPKGGMLPLSAREVTQYLGAHGVSIPIGEGFIGVIALHLGLPVGFEERDRDFF